MRTSGVRIGALIALAMAPLTVLAVLPSGPVARAYDPVPTPTATAAPAPTPTPTPTTTPSPTIAPALPPEPNAPNNPPNPPEAQLVRPGVVEVSRETALATPPRFYIYPASTTIGGLSRPKAPRTDRKVNGRFVPVYSAGDIVRLVATVPEATTFRVLFRAKRPRARYTEVGTVVSDANGRVALPVFRITRAGVYLVTLVDVETGKPYYLEVSVGPRRS